MEILAAELDFDIKAMPEKVWDLLGRAIFDSLGRDLSKMKVIDENNFSAELKVRLGGVIPVIMHLKGEIVNISPPEYLKVKLTTRSRWGMIAMVQMVSFSMKPASDDSTNISCQAMVDGLNPIFRWALASQVKNQAEGVFKNIEECLVKWA